MPLSSRQPTPQAPSPYMYFDRARWAQLRAATPLTLSAEDLDALSGINEDISLREVEEIYLPLSRLLNLHVCATQQLHHVRDTFMGERNAPNIPYIIGMAGSVAVGKSTTARILQALLARWPDHPRVDLVSTDGFLYPNAVLQEKGIMHRKGFPESYDLKRLVRFVSDLKSGVPTVAAPVYSHLVYDIVPNTTQAITRPDIIILEGLNVLQSGADYREKRTPRVFVSDFFDFSIYVDAHESSLERWYLNRFLKLRTTAFQDENSYFHRYASLSEDEATEYAKSVWDRVNATNLQDNIAPTRSRATLVLTKGKDHTVEHIKLRKI